jgi:UDP-N-acetylglucosamine/UDP-N-acetylgalactosamine 4-epimerase
MFNKNLYNTTFHNVDLSKYSFLITGGAGFIGSNIVEYLLRYNAGRVRVLDNLSNGYFDNIKNFIGLPNFEFIEGDIRDIQTCRKALEGIDYLSHQAALGSVPRSINDPITTNDVNVNGFLNVLCAAKESITLKRMVYAASSSTYGDSKELPKVEGREGNPLSPYAVTKLVNEVYAEVFGKVYNFNTIGLRYFNVFGPKQNPQNPYAAVIPLFCSAFINGQQPTIYGDGTTSRDFTFVENVVQANIKSLFYDGLEMSEVFNVACGAQTTLNEMITILQTISKSRLEAVYKEERKGDVKHSKASINKIKSVLNYEPMIEFRRGLELVYYWYLNNQL